MASRFQAVVLAASPSYPNAIAWSDDNFIAVASAHLVTILRCFVNVTDSYFRSLEFIVVSFRACNRKAVPYGPRGLIRVPTCEPYPIGRVNREDLFTNCMLPIALSRDRRPWVRSISWSPIGMAPNYGCLLAVCTVEGRVKIYRPPFCDFTAEWVEVVDVSDRLYDHLAKINFGELDNISSEFSHEQTAIRGCDDEQPKSCAKNLPNSLIVKQYKRRKVDVTTYNIKDSQNIQDQLSDHISGGSTTAGSGHDNKIDRRRTTKVSGNCTLPLITAEQYASRCAMLSSLVIAWSPVLWLSSKICSAHKNDSSNGFSILAVGGKSGKIYAWRIHVPQYYSIEHNRVPTTVTFVGLIQAHNSWVTTISLALLGSKSNPQVLLASGSTDGSVRIWIGKGEELLQSSGVNNAPFSLLKEIISVNIVPISVLSLAVPVQTMHKMLLAVGKGSGSFEVWTADISSSKFDKAGLYDAHDCVVTGLAWAFDGCCLYSCGQGNYVRAWVLRGSSLCEVSIPSNIPGLRSSNDLPNVFVSCLGVAASPGNIALAMVRNVDGDSLDPMYEGRLQKAVVEFFWIGGQQKDILSSSSTDFASEAFLGFSAIELIYWESDFLWYLTTYENLDKPLVVWDIVAALSAFKQSVPKYVDHILVKWLSVTFLGAHTGLSIGEVLTCIPENFSKIASRQLHLLNIICRRVILSDLKADEINCKVKLGGSAGAKGEHVTLWMELLFSSEKELRERLVGFSLAAFISHVSDTATTFSQPGYWDPVGVAQMEQWVALNHDHVKDQLKILTSEIKKHERRLQSSEYGVEEQCIYCSESVPFDSPEVAHCQCSNTIDKTVQDHKMARCAVSMQISNLRSKKSLQNPFVPFVGYCSRGYSQIFYSQHLQYKLSIHLYIYVVIHGKALRLPSDCDLVSHGAVQATIAQFYALLSIINLMDRGVIASFSTLTVFKILRPKEKNM
ncbi:unnamed protein product [Dovyalis caffra]|uniref:Transcription factor IIIC 90kDa subunit N-terminal domain-containing protein n=1 Tax=Dovyalis caffra TaxID=77055 RepID=A0AAV1QU29_9ROSI|nr:unnamed protein product [Dovyalis caffra]